MMNLGSFTKRLATWQPPQANKDLYLKAFKAIKILQDLRREAIHLSQCSWMIDPTSHWIVEHEESLYIEEDFQWFNFEESKVGVGASTSHDLDLLVFALCHGPSSRIHGVL